MIAAAIQKEDRLLLPIVYVFQRPHQTVADRGRVSKAKLLAHIHDHRRRKLGAAVALAERHERVSSAFRFIEAFDRGGGGGQKHQGIGFSATVGRHVSCMILRIALGFIGMLVLLVYDDHAELRKRREDRRARSDHEIHLAAADTAKGIQALALRERGMDHGHAAAVARAKDLHGLRR